MSIDSPEDLAGLKAAGAVVAATLKECRRAVRAGITTADLDAVAGRVFARMGARSGPQLTYDFPGVICISVNDQVVHGVPGSRRLRDGDIVKVDVTAELNGYYSDACITVPVGRVKPASGRLAAASQAALLKGIDAARAGAPRNAIGAAVEAEVTKRGFHVIRELTGHGIGRGLHEKPDVLNWCDPLDDEPLTEGLVITIEPMISAGSTELEELEDGWTLVTQDGARSAHFEHTLVIRRDQPALVLTA
ncbi:type I methionyl aminopeptidase [Conexibacter sp. CPCC 206217]|uniref:type I methionyl aminopeptidase n=1 Tax=Conexibacter sp. CPCC 206217 TaxID=3064574 RepID=UPI00271E1D16|nr:type I methionyl aminopeptidase [Conexibacter sp. CPCC 206217]MDO8212971.1 type I methionyl aminopeptidase [Conexibacter sp. CPCC 206217]